MAVRFFVNKFDNAITIATTTLWYRNAGLDAAMVVVAKWTTIVMLLLIFTATLGIGLNPTAVSSFFLLGHAAVAVASAVTGRLLNEIISRRVSRFRPFEEHGFIPLLRHDGGYSFPSNHTTGAFALAVSMAAVAGFGPVLLCLAVLLACSRIYTGLHYFTDVVAGALNGILLASFWLFVYVTYIPTGIGTS